MVDFSKLVGKQRKRDDIRLTGLFDSLDRKATHTELRTTQKEALKELESTVNEKDVVLRISTGAGKTTVALLYLAYQMRRYEQPVVYLCPTVQLIDQVLAEANSLGITADQYPRGMTHPPERSASGHAVIVCTYDKLFNGRSTFARTDVNLVPAAIVLDDVHAGMESVRRCFSLELPDVVRNELLQIMDVPCRGHMPGPWSAVTKGDAGVIFEIPFWIWRDSMYSVRAMLENHLDEDWARFAWTYVDRILPYTRCFLSGTSGQIVADIPPVEYVKAFRMSKHRLFMSGSIGEGEMLVRELGCAVEAVQKKIAPKSDRGLGERMILVTSLVDTGTKEHEVAAMCAELAKSTNVVVLSHSTTHAQLWGEQGAQIFLGEGVPDAVRALRASPRGKFYVFVQRYDGVDLPDDACRVLVIDGIPFGESLADRIDAHRSGTGSGTRNKLAVRLEQGLGRAVRSHADFAVVLLVGRDLAAFVARSDVRKVLSDDTNRQLVLAQQLSEVVTKESDDSLHAIRKVVDQCLTRDEGWKEFYKSKMQNGRRTSASSDKASGLKLAALERDAWTKALSNDFGGARDLLQRAVDESKSDDNLRGVLLSRLAAYEFEVDRTNAFEIQRKAVQMNPELNPPPIGLGKVQGKHRKQASVVRDWLAGFENANGAIVEIEQLRTRMNFASSVDDVEEAGKDLGRILGANSSRPEKQTQRGPDCLWRFDDRIWVIECKTENQETLHKKDASQMLLSVEWAKETYSVAGGYVPVFFTNVLKADRVDDFSFDPAVSTNEMLIAILDRVKKMVMSLISQGPLFSSNVDVIERKLAEFDLVPGKILQKLAKPFGPKRGNR